MPLPYTELTSMRLQLSPWENFFPIIFMCQRVFGKTPQRRGHILIMYKHIGRCFQAGRGGHILRQLM